MNGNKMAKRNYTGELNLWMNGELVGLWKQNSSHTNEFKYYDSWLESKNSRPISLSMPLAPESVRYSGQVVENFFDNLLPDNREIRKRIQSRFSTRSIEPFDLLSEIGRDCVGAIQLLPLGNFPQDINTIKGTHINEEEISSIIKTVSSTSFPGKNKNDHFRISVAGAQEKTALLFHSGKWYIPESSTPTTHILKLPLGNAMGADMSYSIENEWLCGKIVKAFGVDCANSEIGIFKDQKVLVVERFDRSFSKDGSWILRIPAEDMCQVTGRSPWEKYESDGGPGISDIMKILMGSKDSLKDRHTFFKANLLFWILAAPDGHGKNFSIFIENKGGFRLTPIYDVISAYPFLGKKAGQIAPEKLRMAMAVRGKNKHYDWKNIKTRHWLTTAKKCGAGNIVEDIIQELVEKTPSVINEVSKSLPKDFPSTVSDKIFEGMEKALNILRK